MIPVLPNISGPVNIPNPTGGAAAPVTVGPTQQTAGGNVVSVGSAWQGISEIFKAVNQGSNVNGGINMAVPSPLRNLGATSIATGVPQTASGIYMPTNTEIPQWVIPVGGLLAGVVIAFVIVKMKK